MIRNSPCEDWESKNPDELGMSAEKLNNAENLLLDESQGEPFRAVVVRHGYIAAEWSHGIGAGQHIRQASAGKSFYSCMLGIAVSEGKIPTLDARVVDYYPEMMEVKEGEGPKEGRYAFEEDREITFRQLICNTSGYMKPGEQPGKHFHYQDRRHEHYHHSLATIYGAYDSDDPDRLPGSRRASSRTSGARGGLYERCPR